MEIGLVRAMEREYDERQSQGVSYELSSDKMRQVVRELLDERPLETQQRFVSYELMNDTPGANVARTVERIVFDERFGNDAKDMERLYGPYEDASRFLLSVDQHNGEPVGAMRIMENSPAGIMTLNNLPEEATGMTTEEILAHHKINTFDKFWDVGTVAVLPEYRQQGGGISIQLYRGFYKSAQKHDIEHVTAIIDKKPYETMSKYLGIPFVPLGNSKGFSFEGSDASFAVYGHVSDFYRKMSRKSRTPVGFLARKALRPLVFGTRDDAIQLDDR